MITRVVASASGAGHTPTTLPLGTVARAAVTWALSGAVLSRTWVTVSSSE